MTTGPVDGGVAFEEIPRDECLALLGSQVLGRVAVADFNAAPLVVPVNYALDGDAVVFRTDYGSKFRLAVLGEAPVSFQIDGVDPGRRTGWSVLLQGHAAELADEDVERLRLDPSPWAPGQKPHWVRISPLSLTGRRITLAEPLAPDARGYI